jgi:signal transduction histidine kinase
MSKINQMKTQAIKEVIARLETMKSGNYTKEQDKKNWSELPKGRETMSHYFKHLKEELGRRTH